MTKRPLWALISAIALFGSGCIAPSPLRSMRLVTNENLVQKEVLAAIPLGTPVEVAQARMERMGYVCEVADIVGIRALCCTKAYRLTFGVMGIWTVTMFTPEGVIDSVDAAYRMKGVGGGMPIE